MTNVMWGIFFTLNFSVIGYGLYKFYVDFKNKKQLQIKIKEFNDLERRTLEIRSSNLSQEELKFEEGCLLLDAAYIDKKYGTDFYYNTLIQSEKGKT